MIKPYSVRLKVTGKFYLILLLISLSAIMIVAILHNQFYSKPNSAQLTNQNNQTITPGSFPTASCPAHLYQSWSKITNVSGFTIYNVSGVNDYVIAPGNNGKITYRVFIGAKPSFDITIGTIANWAQVYHNSHRNTTQNTHQGINFSISPISEIFSFNSKYTVNVSINTSSTAASGTYWVSFSPGFCFGGPVFLLTVGNSPYNGIIQKIPIP